jgi:hypothetical protein
MDLQDHLKRQMAFSKATFGPGNRKEGVIDHIRQELNEVSTDGDPREWVDLVILSLDGLWRSLKYPKDSTTKNFVLWDERNSEPIKIARTWGNIPEIVVRLIEEKQSKNEQRDWPDWRTADPNKAINHDRSKD